jgi:N-acetylmuramoyl-L-alanine amidase
MLAIAGCSVALAMVAAVLHVWQTDGAPSHAHSASLASVPAVPPVASGARGGQALRTTHVAATRASRPSQAAGAGKLAGIVIVIDPGHNPGNSRYPSEINRQVPYGAGMKPCDTTGTATNDGYSEAAYTLDVFYRVVALLRAQGATVVLTHTRTSPPWGPCITERAAIGNRRHAAAAISIHADGGPPRGRGFSTIIPAAPTPSVGLTSSMIAADLKLALDVRNAYLAAYGMRYSSYLGSLGVYRSNAYGGTNLSHVPKIFIETGNMRNATDAGLLESATFRQRAARGIASGIARFVARR